tara:strand:+ start:33393 stop:34229 length:837 start_codon:yes stop_codon:yes gene_type:complete
MVNNYILIDTSYFIFYRYYALINWWKMAKKDEPQLLDPFLSEEFVQKFRKTFIDKLYEIPKKLKIKKNDYIFIAALDCPRKNIWRNDLFQDYKGTREYDDTFMGGPFFELGIQILKELNITSLKFDRLEADDCVALTCKQILEKNTNSQLHNKCLKITIIASDMDYLQLLNDNINIINLKYKSITESKNASTNAEYNLFCKIVMGDKSDNIPPIFKKCGIKTAQKYYHDKELFENELSKSVTSRELFERNKKIIDFNYIPEELVNSFNLYLKQFDNFM